MRYIFLVVLLLIGIDLCAAAKAGAGAGGGSGSGSDEDTRRHSVEGSRSSGDSSPLSVHSLGGEEIPPVVLEQAARNASRVLSLLESLKDASVAQIAETVPTIHEAIQSLPDYVDSEAPHIDRAYAPEELKDFWKRRVGYWHSLFLQLDNQYKESTKELHTKIKMEDVVRALNAGGIPLTQWGKQTLQQSLGSLIFSPDDIAVMGARPAWYGNNMRIQYALAIAAGYGNPVALDYLGEIFSTVGALNEDMKIKIGETLYTFAELYNLTQTSAKTLYAAIGTEDIFARSVAIREVDGRKDALDFLRPHLSKLDTTDPRLLFDFAYIVRSHPPLMAPLPFPTANKTPAVAMPEDVPLRERIDVLEHAPEYPYNRLVQSVNAARAKAWKFFNDNENAGKKKPIESGPLFYDSVSRPSASDKAAMAHNTSEYLQQLYGDLFTLTGAFKD